MKKILAAIAAVLSLLVAFPSTAKAEPWPAAGVSVQRTAATNCQVLFRWNWESVTNRYYAEIRRAVVGPAGYLSPCTTGSCSSWPNSPCIINLHLACYTDPASLPPYIYHNWMWMDTSPNNGSWTRRYCAPGDFMLGARIYTTLSFPDSWDPYYSHLAGGNSKLMAVFSL